MGSYLHRDQCNILLCCLQIFWKPITMQLLSWCVRHDSSWFTQLATLACSVYTACAAIPPSQVEPVFLDVVAKTERICTIWTLTRMGTRPVLRCLLGQGFFPRLCQDKFGHNVLMIRLEDFGNQNAFRLLLQERVWRQGAYSGRWYSRHWGGCYRLTCCLDTIDGNPFVGPYISVSRCWWCCHRYCRFDNVHDFFGKQAFHGGGSDKDILGGLTRPCYQARPVWTDYNVTKYCMYFNWLTTVRIESHVRCRIFETYLLDWSIDQTQDVWQGDSGNMTEWSDHPIISALSNTTSKAECPARETYEFSNGKAIFSGGSPFAPVTLKDKSLRVPGPGNNVYVISGVGLDILARGSSKVMTRDMLIAAKSLAAQVLRTQEEQQLDIWCVYPATVRDSQCEFCNCLGRGGEYIRCRSCNSSHARWFTCLY